MANFATARVVIRGINRLPRPLRGAAVSLVRFRNKALRVIRDINRQLNRFNQKIRGIGSAFKNIIPGVGLLSLGGLIYGGKSAIETAAEFEAIETAIRFVSGSAIEGNKNMNFLRDTVNKMKIDYRVTAESFKRFLGAMKATNYQADVQRDMFYKMSAATRVLGLNAESTERVFYALGEMFSKGQVMSQELKLQLGNALPGAVDMFAKSMGLSNKAFREMMEAGNISTKYIRGFVDYVYEQFKDGVPAAIKTTAASLQHLKNNWTFTMQDIGQSLADAGILDVLSQYLSGISLWVKANKELIKTNVSKAVEWVRKVGGFIINNWSSIARGMKYILGIFLGFKATLVIFKGLELILAGGSPLILGIIALGAAIGAGTVYFREYRSELSAVKKDLSAIEGIIVGVGNIVEAFTMPEFENMGKKIIAGLGQLILSIIKAAFDLAEVSFRSLANLFGLKDNFISRFFKSSSEDYGRWTKQLDVWAQTPTQKMEAKMQTTKNIMPFSDRKSSAIYKPENVYQTETPMQYYMESKKKEKEEKDRIARESWDRLGKLSGVIGVDVNYNPKTGALGVKTAPEIKLEGQN